MICGLYWLLLRDECVSFVDVHCNYCRLTRLLGPPTAAETLDRTLGLDQLRTVVDVILFRMRLKKKLSVEAGKKVTNFNQDTLIAASTCNKKFRMTLLIPSTPFCRNRVILRAS